MSTFLMIYISVYGTMNAVLAWRVWRAWPDQPRLWIFAALFGLAVMLMPFPARALEARLPILSDLFVLPTSTNTDGGTLAVREVLIPGKTHCLLGQSGVGKSSLLNRLVGSSICDINEVREKDGKGRHTTVRGQLVATESGSSFIDTPGIRELGNFQVDSGLDMAFAEFSILADQCRYADCTHTHERGCAVVAAVEKGEIDEARYGNFLKIRNESEFYDLSYEEKRKKQQVAREDQETIQETQKP